MGSIENYYGFQGVYKVQAFIEYVPYVDIHMLFLISYFELLFCTRPHVKHFMCMISFKSHNSVVNTKYYSHLQIQNSKAGQNSRTVVQNENFLLIMCIEA